MTQNSFHKETAYFASGCFWGTQYHLEKVKGVDIRMSATWAEQ